MRALTLVPLLFVLVGVGLTSAGPLPPLLGLGVVALGALFGLPVSLYVLVAQIRKGRPGLWPFAIVAILPLAMATPLVVLNLRYPLINDVTTDTANPPSFTAALEDAANTGRDMAFPERFGPIVRESYTDLQPLLLDESTAGAFQRIAELAERQPGWEVKRRDATTQVIEGEASSTVLGFIDDFVIRVTEQDGQARVDMRSKSRVGQGDVGVNAKRIRGFLQQLREP